MEAIGLFLQPDILDEEKEKEIISWIDSQEWNTSIKRRTQHYGYEYNYSSKDIKKTVPLTGPILELATYLIENKVLVVDGMDHVDDVGSVQCIVNEYTKDQGISAHTDRNVFGPTIVSFSLGADTNMIFRPVTNTDQQKLELYLPRRSILIMGGQSRTDWTHEIPIRETVLADGKRVHKDGDYRRVSLTFRTVL